MNKIIKSLIALLVLGFVIAVSGCDNDSDVVSENLSTDADNYKIFRQIVVYNAITDEYVLELNGYCSLGNEDSSDRVSYTCKTPEGYVKDIILKSDNTFVFVHQLKPQNVSDDFYKVTLKPTTVIPDLEFNSGS